jgi:chromosome segregation ATPase
LKTNYLNLQSTLLEKEQEYVEHQLLGEGYRQSTSTLEAKMNNYEHELIEHKKEINQLTSEKGEVHQIVCQINDMICTSFGI